MKRIIAGAVTAFLLAAGGVVATALPASAHTGNVSATAVCNTSTGNYDVTYTIVLSNVPDNKAGTTKWRFGAVGAGFEGTPTSFDGLTAGSVDTKGNATINAGTVSIPGTSTRAQWLYAYTKWTDYAAGSDGGDIPLDGTCKKPDSATATADITVTPATCTSIGTASWTNLNNVAKTTDINPAVGPHTGTATAKDGYVFTGTTSKTKDVGYTIPDKLKPTDPACQLAAAPISFTEPTCTEQGHAAWGTFTNATGKPDPLLQTVNTPLLAVATANPGYTFQGGQTTQSTTYTLKPALGYQSTDPGKPCFVAPKDASATLKVTPATCTDPGTASWVDVKFANVSRLDQTPGKDNVGVATAFANHEFSDGSTQQSTKYTVPAATGYQSTDPSAPCFVAPKDAVAALTVTPATCTADGSAAWTTLTNATGGALDQKPGDHSGVATANANHAFADGTATLSIGYTVAAKTPSQSKDASAPCYVKPPSGLASTGSSDMTGPLFLGAGILAAGALLAGIGIYRRRHSDS